MAKKSAFNFSEDWLKQNGFTENDKGVYSKPKNISRALNLPERFIVKQKINNSSNFQASPVTEWFIPYQIPSKKNSRRNFVRNGKQISIPSERYAKYKSVTKKYWEVFGIEFNQTIKKLELSWPVNIEMTFVRSTKQVIDYFGPGESVFDLMTDFGWWPDDNSRYGKPSFGDIEVDKNNPGTRIKLLLK